MLSLEPEPTVQTKIIESLLGDKASSIKVARHLLTCKKTTSGSIGIRLCGLRVIYIDDS